MATEPGFEAGIRASLPAMWALAWRLAGSDAEDVVQEALLQAWRTRSSYDASRASLRTWLLLLVTDRCRKRVRRLRSTPLHDALPETGQPDVPPDIDLSRAVGALAPRQRLAVELHYVIGLDVNETAAVMRCSPGTVKSTLYDARARLRAVLEDI